MTFDLTFLSEDELAILSISLTEVTPENLQELTRINAEVDRRFQRDNFSKALDDAIFGELNEIDRFIPIAGRC